MKRSASPTDLARHVQHLSWGKDGAPSPSEGRHVLATRETVMTQFQAESGYTSMDSAVLWDAVERFIGGLSNLVCGSVERDITEKKIISRVSSEAFVCSRPWGRVLICIPANATVPLAAIVPLALLVAGNAVVVAGSRRTLATTDALVSAVAQLAPERVVLWEGRFFDAVELLVEPRLVDCVYFMGSSGFHPALASRCADAGIHLIYEGEGNGCAVIDETVQDEILNKTASALVESKHFCFGRMCSAPNTIAVHEEIADALIDRILELGAGRPLPFSLPRICGIDRWAMITKMIESGTCIRPDLAHLAFAPGQVVVLEGSTLHATLERELLCPAVHAVRWSDWNLLIQEIGVARHRLQLTLFTQDSSRQREVVDRTHFARYCFNRCPTVQDPLLAWGNFGRSGESRVQDFVAKGLRPMIIEGMVDTTITENYDG